MSARVTKRDLEATMDGLSEGIVTLDDQGMTELVTLRKDLAQRYRLHLLRSRNHDRPGR